MATIFTDIFKVISFTFSAKFVVLRDYKSIKKVLVHL